MLNHLVVFFFFCFFFSFFFLRLGLGQRRAVVIIGRWLLPSLVDTGDICCHYWQHILGFLKNSNLCSTPLQNRNLYWIFLDEVDSDQSRGIVSPFMGTYSCDLVTPYGNINLGQYSVAPSHYLNQCWFIIKGTLWHSPVSSFHYRCSEMTLLKLMQHLNVANELIMLIDSAYIVWRVSLYS